MSALSRCAFSEGSVALPEGYADRTVNVLLAGDDVSSINISRDALQPAENPKATSPASSTRWRRG